MNDSADLSQEPGTLQQQPPLMKKKSKLIFIACIIPLLIINLRYFGLWLATIIFVPGAWSWLFYGMLVSSPQILALSILDLIAASFYFKENSKRIWKTTFILAFTVNVISLGGYLLSWFYSHLELAWLLENPPHLVGLFLVDLITVLIYVSQRYSHRFSRLVKGIIYACLITAWVGVIAISYGKVLVSLGLGQDGY